MSFEPEHIVALGLDGAIAIAPGDTDRDGDVDLVVAAWDENRIFHIANNGDGTFGQPTTITEFAGASRVALFGERFGGVFPCFAATRQR